MSFEIRHSKKFYLQSSFNYNGIDFIFYKFVLCIANAMILIVAKYKKYQLENKCFSLNCNICYDNICTLCIEENQLYFIALFSMTNIYKKIPLKEFSRASKRATYTGPSNFGNNIKSSSGGAHKL